MQAENTIKKLKFIHALIPVLTLLIVVAYGLVIRPLVFGQAAFPLEFVFIFSATITIAELIWLGYKWIDIRDTIVEKLAMAIPAFLILFTIGIIIGSWMISGTIPMLVYYGLKIIDPSYLYLLTFWVSIVFSLMTGTSWGSVGSIGIVFIGIAGAMGANLGITAAAVIGGAFFGDKMSPLSDTTNVAAIATDIKLFEHIHSMMYTTVPSAIITSLIYFSLGFVYSPEMTVQLTESSRLFMESLESSFNFNFLLLIPPAVILFGSLKRKPILPTMIVSMIFACFLAIIFQSFPLSDILQSLIRGFDIKMIAGSESFQNDVVLLLNRGGLYSLVDAIVIAFSVFVFIGAMAHIDAMPTVVNRAFRFSKSRESTILSALAATAVTNSLTSHQYATSFIVGGAFKEKFDLLKIPRKVLSRSLEDAGTMLESLVPWTPSAVFMVTTLGVAYHDYWHWQFMSLINLLVAPILAITGLGCFYKKNNSDQ